MVARILIGMITFSVYVLVGVLVPLFVPPVRAFIDHHPVVFFFAFIGYCFFAIFLWFFLEHILFSIRPIPTTPVSRDVIQAHIAEYFSSGSIVAVEQKKNTIILRWSSNVSANQVINQASINRRISWIIRFYEGSHIVRVNTVEKEFSWSINPPRFRIYYSGGIAFEKSNYLIPSMTLTDGKPVMNIQRVSYNASDIFQPLLYIASHDGWTVTSGSFQSLLLTNIIKYFSLSVALFFFLISGLVYVTDLDSIPETISFFSSR